MKFAKPTGVLSVALLVVALFGCGGSGGGGGSGSSGSSGASGASDPSATGSGTSTPPPKPISAADAARLADQATFGSTPAVVASIQSMTASEWINSQISTPSTGYPVQVAFPQGSGTGCPKVELPTADPAEYPTGYNYSLCSKLHYTAFLLQRTLMTNAISGPDQLRQRVAFALSQMMVTSSQSIQTSYAMREYQQLLLNDAFVNFRQLLNDVTLSPTMGDYLNVANNAKADPITGRSANENYAREVLQLFTIGLNELNQDGSTKTDSSGKPIPAFDQDVIEGFASVFTGWTYPPAPGATSKWRNTNYYIGQMVPFDGYHDTGSKLLLSGIMLPAGGTTVSDLKAGLDNIFNHPNVGPFIGTQLIQALVTSNPSPAYISRVSAVFADNGQGVRGDMGAVVKAILLDPEARGDAPATTQFGKLREPVQSASALMRLFPSSTDGEYFINAMSGQGENLFNSLTVFNFYPPSYLLPDSNLLAPQYGIVNTATVLNRFGMYNTLIYGKPIAADANVAKSIGTALDLTSLEPMTTDPASMISYLNGLMLHGAMTTDEQTVIIKQVTSIAATDQLDRARMAVFLFAISPRFQTQR